MPKNNERLMRELTDNISPIVASEGGDSSIIWTALWSTRVLVHGWIATAIENNNRVPSKE